MSYLTDAVTELSTAAENATLYHVVSEHGHGGKMEATDFAETVYRNENRYTGHVYTVSEPVVDGHNVVVIEDEPAEVDDR